MNTPSHLSLLEATVLQLMDAANSRSIIPNKRAARYNQQGDLSLPEIGTETSTTSAIYRSAQISSPEEQQALSENSYKATNAIAQLANICQHRSSRNMFAFRPKVRASQELMKDEFDVERCYTVTYFDKTCYLTYEDVWSKIECFGRGLHELGLVVGGKVGIFLNTRWEWLVSAYGTWSQSMVLVTVHANLGDEALCCALGESYCGAIVTTVSKVPGILDMMRTGKVHKAAIIYLDGPLKHCVTEGFVVHAWEDVVRNGALSDSPVPIPRNNDDLALIMYTNGTTGQAKGVMHTHGSLTAGIRVLGERLNEMAGTMEQGETYVAALPLSFIFEFAVVNVFLTRGSLVCFGHPHTLLNSFARPHGDLVEFKPLLMIGVPRIFDMMKKTFEAMLPRHGSLERKIFDHAFHSRAKSIREGMETPMWNDSVFAQMRRQVGGRLRYMVSGGGPISAPTQIFMDVVIANFTQGWGLTETVSLGSKQLVGDSETTCVGAIERTVDLRLKDIEEYKHTDYPEPRGEICLRGPFLFKGYYKQPELTKQVLDEDGWFHTGDIGSLTERGRLRIIGRLTGIVKNSRGESIAVEALESLYAQHPLCTPDGVCLLVKPSKNYICALVCTDEAKVMKFAVENDIGGKFPELLRSKTLVARATESMLEIARGAKRGPHEMIRRVAFVADKWQPAPASVNTEKRRQFLVERYKDIVQELFAE